MVRESGLTRFNFEMSYKNPHILRIICKIKRYFSLDLFINLIVVELQPSKNLSNPV